MTENVKDMMAARADAAPGLHLDIDAVVRAGQRRVWRNRAAAGTVACAMLAAVAFVASTLPFVGRADDPTLSESGGERQISYASGSMIHYGDRSIDVSPHKVEFYVLTDDGFVYAAQNGNVYFTDGDGSEKIGDSTAGHMLVADDTGSYVGWVERLRSPYVTQAVVYDTARGREVFRSPKSDSRSDDGCFSEDSGLLFSAIDGDTAYICDGIGFGVSAWDLTTQTRKWPTTNPPRPESWLTDVDSGYLAWSTTEFAETKGTIVSRDPDADAPFYPQVSANQLSPDADYIAGGDNGQTLVFDRTTNQEVELTMPEYPEWYVMQWVADDRFTAMGFHAEGDEGNAREAPDLLTCDASSAMCTVVGQASGGHIIPPTGIDYWQ
jgi:hypothetical protein